MKNGKLKISLSIVIFLLFIAIVFAVDFSPVDLIPNNATTTDILACTWNDTTRVNVTWYNNSVQHGNTIINASQPQIIASALTKRDDVWNCTVVEWNDPTNILSDIVSIQNANPNPVSLGDTRIEEDTTWSDSLVSVDPDGDLVEFFCLPASTLDTCSAAGSVSWTTASSDVEPNSSKLYNVSFYAYDPYNGISVKRVTFNVTSVNDRPAFSVSKLQNISVNETEKMQYSLTLTDEENNTGPFSFFVNSSYYPPIERLEYSTVNNKNFIIQFLSNRTVLFNDSGNFTVWVRACDPVNSSLCINDSFRLEIVSLNHAPNFTFIESKAGNFSQGQTFTLSLNATDIDGDTLNFTVTSSCSLTNPWILNVLNNSASASIVLNATPLNNSHIKCRDVTISVTDQKSGDTSVNLNLNITNTNDLPVINPFSFYSGNSHSNRNITNLTGYTNVAFSYKVNATDADIEYGVDPAESLVFRVNSSICTDCPHLTLNQSTGLITFMPNSSFIGTFRYEANVTDAYGSNDTETMIITVFQNEAPYFIQLPPNLTIYEDTYFNITINATDPEGSLDTFSDNSSLFDINSTGFLSITPSCSQTGNFSTTIKINDTIGRENQSSFNLEVIMLPDPPVLPLLANTTILEEISYSIELNTSTTDEDYSCNQGDTKTFTSRFMSGSTLFNITSGGIISFTPDNSSSGNYLINITIFDAYGLADYLLWNITIINRTEPPVINNITPYGYPYYTNWTTPGNLGADYTTINITENTSVYYDHNSTDPDGNEMLFNWTIDNVYYASTTYLNKSWNFTDSGIHNVTLSVFDIVNNTIAHKVSFSWITQVTNFNRLPILINNLSDVNVTGAITIGNYLICGNYFGGDCTEVRFYDPDGDTLTYTYSNASLVDIDIAINTVTFTGLEIGDDTMYFTASDGYGSVDSNIITVHVLSVLEEDSESNTNSNSNSGGSSQGGPAPYYVFEEVEKLKDLFLDILVPEPITLYKNNTLREVIRLVNKGNETLRGIFLSAKTNATDAEISFSKYYFPELPPGKTETTEIIITAYKLLNHYEIVVYANVSNPKYTDKAVIFINALEKSRGNQSVTSTKITFTEDLLSSNPECIELNEFIKKAQLYMESGDYDEASVILDSIIQGCKYLVSQRKLHEEKPDILRLPIDLNSSPYLKPALLVFAMFLITAVIMTIRMKKINDKDSS